MPEENPPTREAVLPHIESMSYECTVSPNMESMSHKYLAHIMLKILQKEDKKLTSAAKLKSQAHKEAYNTEEDYSDDKDKKFNRRALADEDCSIKASIEKAYEWLISQKYTSRDTESDQVRITKTGKALIKNLSKKDDLTEIFDFIKNMTRRIEVNFMALEKFNDLARPYVGQSGYYACIYNLTQHGLIRSMAIDLCNLFFEKERRNYKECTIAALIHNEPIKKRRCHLLRDSNHDPNMIYPYYFKYTDLIRQSYENYQAKHKQRYDILKTYRDKRAAHHSKNLNEESIKKINENLIRTFKETLVFLQNFIRTMSLIIFNHDTALEIHNAHQLKKEFIKWIHEASKKLL